ncbi:MAG: Ig-like domain repeat protein, partial [Planctomycetes bacterium]|nr:Ig-like domain repeat protein [Planctomycetota bacterium]
GTVTFFDTFTDSAGNTTTTAIPGGTNVPLDATGFASISTSFSTVGTHTITIDYSGDSFYTPSTATLNPDLVVTNPLVAFISANTNPVQVGGSTIYTITTNGLPGQPVPAGRIDLKINGAVVGAGFLNATGQTAIAVRATATGSQTVSVDFTSANDNYLSGTDVATMTPPEQVNPGGNVFLFTSSNNPALPNTPITFTLSHPQAQGTVVFRLNGTTVLGTALLNTDPFTGAFILSPASITLDGMMGRLLGLPVLPNGSYTITAVYTAAPGNAIPSQTITLQPNQFSTEPITAALTSSASPAQANTPITFTFVPAVAAQGAQPAPPPNPTGTVTFRDQTTGAILGTAPLAVDPISGRLQAQLTLPNGLTAGNHNITASYSGDSVYSTFTTALVPTQTVIGGNQVQTSVSSSANTAVLGTNVTFTYTAGGGNLQLPPTGTVTFFDGTTPIGVAQVLSGGVASISTAALTVGVHNITARYSGDANYVASTTTLSPRQRIVNPPFAQLALDLTPTDYTGSVPALDPTTGAPTQVTGQQVIFTVNLRTNTLPNVTTPLATGTVRFFAAPIINGVVGARVQIGMDQTLAGVPAGNPTNATASVIVPTGFATGSYRITAEYSGDTRYEPLTLTLNPDLTIVATAAQLPAQSASSSVAAQQPGLELRGAIAGTTPAGGTPPGIIKSGVGTLTLSGASTYPGTTTINGTGGSIALTVDNALPVGTDLIINSGTFDLNGKAQTVASLSGNSGGIVAFTGGGTLTAGAGGTDSSFDGVLTGAGTLTKVGAGTLTLSRGSNPGFTGTLNATAGTLVVNANYGTATATAQSGGTLSGAGGTVGTTTIGTGGTLAPGTNGQPGSFNTGAVTFNGGAFAVDLARVGGTLTADLLTATALTVGSAAPVLKLNTAAYTGMSLADPAVTILTVTGAGGLPAGFRFSRADGTIINDGEYVGVGGRAFQVRYTATGVTVEFAGLLTVGTFAATPNPSDPGAGHPVTITVTFGPGAPGDPPPTGTVTFTDSLGGTFTTPVITTDANGNLVATTTGLFPALGTHVVTASFSGSTNGYVDTSSSYNQVVNIATTTTLTTSNPSVGAGQSVTFTATVTSTGTPTGTVTFVNMTTNEALGTVALDANGQASLTTTVAPGSNTIRAFYSGDATFRVSTADVTQVVVSASQSQQPYYTNAFVINGLLVLQGSGVPGGIAVIPVPAGSSALFTDVNGDGNGDVILILPNLIAVLDGKTGQPIAIAADVNGDGVRDLLIFNPDGSVTTTDGKTGRTI